LFYQHPRNSFFTREMLSRWIRMEVVKRNADGRPIEWHPSEPLDECNTLFA
jgi:hypothetical protein